MKATSIDNLHHGNIAGASVMVTDREGSHWVLPSQGDCQSRQGTREHEDEENMAIGKDGGESREGNTEYINEDLAALASHFKHGICPPESPFAKAYRSVLLHMVSTDLVLSWHK